MSRIKVKEEVLGPLVEKGAQFRLKTFHEYLEEGDKEPITIDHEISFNSVTVLIEKELMAAGCWRRDADNCFRFSSKIKDDVLEILKAALTMENDEVSEVSSPNVQQPKNTTPIKSNEPRKRLYRDDADTANTIVDSFSCPVVTNLGHDVKMVSLLDGKVGFEGTLLCRTAPLLETILHFQPLDPPASSSSPDALQWVSKWPLNLAERNFVVHILEHRLPALVANEDQKVIIPAEAEPVPQRFRPHTNSGKPLNGPYISRQSQKPWNIGRQYFSTFNRDDKDGFLWADGTTGWSDESKQRELDFKKKEKEKEKQQGLLHLVGEFDLLDPGEVLEEEGSDEWDGEMCAGMPQIDVQVAASPPKRQRV